MMALRLIGRRSGLASRGPPLARRYATAQRLAIFDKDGTLLDDTATWGPLLERCARDIGTVVEPSAFFKAMGYDADRRIFLAGSLFMTAPTSEIEASLHSGLGADAAAACMRWLEDMPPEEAAGFAIAPLPPLFEALRDHGYRTAVLTNDERRFTEAFLEGASARALVDDIVACDDGLDGKPAPGPALELCRRAGVLPARAAIVGDSSRDVECGLAAGLGLVVGVESGVESGASLEVAGAHVVLPTVVEAVEVLVGWEP